MRFLITVLMAFMVFAAVPTLAAADVDAPMEQSADSVDEATKDMSATNASDVVSDVDLTRDLETIAALQAPRTRARYKGEPIEPGPHGFRTGIWRPVASTDSTLLRTYGSGVMLIRC